MYQFSRSLYRELADLVVDDRVATAAENRQHFLVACEGAFKRLASDRHYFARPARSLFRDVRGYFAMTSQMRVYLAIDRHMAFATQYVDQREREGISLDGNPLCCHPRTGSISSSHARERSSAWRAIGTTSRVPHDRCSATCAGTSR